MTENVVIIGSGPAGYTAAVYAARANLNPLMFAGEPHDVMLPGGQLMLTSDVENYPGFPEGVQGPELMEKFKAQAERFGTRIEMKDVTKVDFSKRPLEVWAGDRVVRTKTVIIATGAGSKWLGLPSEKALFKRGVTSCATCDGFFHRGKPVVVVGGGDSALEEALFLSRMCESVTVVHRRDALRASKIMQRRAFENPKIKFVWDSVVTEVLDVDLGKVTGVRIRNVKTNKEDVLPCTGLFVAIGHEPNTALFKGQIQLDEKGYIVTRPGSSYTSVPGVFAAGDAADHVYRQAVTAAGTGCMAAIDAERWLETEEARKLYAG